MQDVIKIIIFILDELYISDDIIKYQINNFIDCKKLI